MSASGPVPAPGVTVLVEMQDAEPGDFLPLAGSEVHHLRVRRAEAGTEVRFLNGRGVTGRGRVRLGTQPGVEVESSDSVPRPVALTLAVGAGDRDRFGWLIEKACELGVTDLVPLETERTGSVGSRLRSEHLVRLGRRALEAAKQCGAPWATVVHPPAALAEFAGWVRVGACFLADANGEMPPAVLPIGATTVGVGPEGGFTEPERELLRRAGFTPIALGPYVLRFETAALAAAAAVGAALHRGRHAR